MYSKNIWKGATDNKFAEIMNFAEGYKKFITLGKTERLCVNEAV